MLTARAEAALAKYDRALPAAEAGALRRWTATFWPFQQEWLFDDSRFALLNKSRKIGFSHTSSGLCTKWGVFHGDTSTIISIGDREAKEVLELASKLARLLQELGSRNAALVKATDHEIRFASGGRILALPASGGRSYSGNVFLDEYAYHKDPETVWDNAAPVITVGKHRLRVVSTPNGAGNDFHRLVEIAKGPPSKTNKWSFHEVSLERAIPYGYPVDIDDCWALAKGDNRLFAQMFDCSFLDNVLQYIPSNVIEDCLISSELEDERGGIHYAGLDIGREADLTALVIIRLSPATRRLRIVHVETVKRTEPEAIQEMVDAAFARYKLKRLAVDSTGLGAFPAASLKKRHSERYDVPYRRPRVELIDFGPKSKEALATGLYAAMSDGRLELPATDRQLPAWQRDRELDGKRCVVVVNAPGSAEHIQREIGSIQRVVTASANIQYVTPRTRDGHADRAWALMLAVLAIDAVHPMVRALTMAQENGAK